MQDQILCLAWSEQYFSFDMCFPEFRPLLRWRSSHSAKSKKLKNRLQFLVWRKPTVRQMWGFILKSFGLKNLIIYLGKLKLNNRSIKKWRVLKYFHHVLIPVTHAGWVTELYSSFWGSTDPEGGTWIKIWASLSSYSLRTEVMRRLITWNCCVAANIVSRIFSPVRRSFWITKIE